MSLFESRYKNFQAFVESQLGAVSPIVMVLNAMSHETFLGLIIKMAGDYRPDDSDCDQSLSSSAVFPRPHIRLTPRDAMTKIAIKLDIDLAKFDSKSLEKFERYCEYFLEVALG